MPSVPTHLQSVIGPGLRALRQLKQAVVEIADFERRYGKLFDGPVDRRTSYMAWTRRLSTTHRQDLSKTWFGSVELANSDTPLLLSWRRRGGSASCLI